MLYYCSMSTTSSYTLRDRGAELCVETSVARGEKKPNRARLLIDREEVEPGQGDVRRRSLPYAPPPGTRAARVHAWGEAHPTLYAVRHPLLQLLGTAAAVLGIGAVVQAFVSGLLPRLDLGWLPELEAQGWLRYLDPGRYLAPLLGWVTPLGDRLLGWLPDVELGWAKYVVGFLVAVTVAVRETRRRRRAAHDPADDTQENDRS